MVQQPKCGVSESNPGPGPSPVHKIGQKPISKGLVVAIQLAIRGNHQELITSPLEFILTKESHKVIQRKFVGV